MIAAPAEQAEIVSMAAPNVAATARVYNCFISEFPSMCDFEARTVTAFLAVLPAAIAK